MISTNIKRVIRSGFINFWRNGTVSFASVLVMVISLSVITGLILTSAVSDSMIAMLKEKVDINIYIKTNIEEADILELQEKLKVLPEVSSVEYTSKEEALANFKERHSDNSLILSSLDELKENPLGAVLSVKAKEPSQYEGIANFLESGEVSTTEDGVDIIDKVNFFQNKLVIDRLSKIIESTQKIGFYTTLALVVLAIFVTLNTIRLAIYTSREEISVMRLVGAGNWYIRGPFVVSGIMSGVFASIITLIIFYPLTIWIGDKTESFLAGINLFSYYKQNFLQISFIVVSTAVILGSVSSFISVRRYLNV